MSIRRVKEKWITEVKLNNNPKTVSFQNKVGQNLK